LQEQYQIKLGKPPLEPHPHTTDHRFVLLLRIVGEPIHSNSMQALHHLIIKLLFIKNKKKNKKKKKKINHSTQ
jgi:hypothetical protein